MTRGEVVEGSLQTQLSTFFAKNASSTTFFGRCYCIACKGLSEINDIVSRTEAFHSLSKFFVSLSEAVSPANYLYRFSITVTEVDTWIDGLKIFRDICDWIELSPIHQLQRGRFAEFCSNAVFLVADASATVSLVGFLRLVELGGLAFTFGAVGLFGQGIAFGFAALQQSIDFQNGDKSKRNVAWLATSIAEVAHKLFLALAGTILVSTAGIVLAGVLGMIANGIGVYAEHHYPEAGRF